MMDEIIKVYAKLDENKIITAINSSIFLHDAEGWVVIDEWTNGLPRDRYVHAQGSYLPNGLTDHNGHYNYKFDSALMELTDEEKEIFFPAPTPLPTTEERIEALENAMLEMILGGMV